MRNLIKALVQRWTEEVLDNRAQAKQDACGHWVSGTIRDGIFYCDACDKVLTEEDANSGAQSEERSAIDQRYVDKVL